MKKELDLSKESILKLFIKYSIPSIIGMVVMSLYMIIDGIFVGNGVGSDGLAAVNIAMPFINFGIAISMMIAIGGGTLSSIELGKDDKKKASEIFSLTFTILVGISLIITVLAVVFRNQLPQMLGATPKLADDVKNYLVILALGNTFFMGTILLDIGLRSTGRPNFSIIIMAISSVMNIVLDYIFIMKFNWGISGAAWSTTISQTMSFVVLIYQYFKKDATLKLVKPMVDKDLIKRIFTNGSSEFVSSMSVGITTLLFNLAIMERVGEKGVAAFSIIGYVGTVIMAITIGISQAMQPIVSYNYGAKENKRVLEMLKLSLGVVFVIGVITTLVMFNFARPLISLFTKGDIGLLDMTTNAARIYSLAFMLSGINIMSSAYFTAIENAKVSALISILRGLIMVVIGIYTLPLAFGINGIWMAVPFAEIITLGVALAYLLGSKKKLELEHTVNKQDKAKKQYKKQKHDLITE